MPHFLICTLTIRIYMPDELQPTNNPVTSAVAAVAAMEASAAGSSGIGGTESLSSVGQVDGGTAQPTRDELVSIREVLGDYGIASDQFEDDRAALRALADGYRQASQPNFYAQLGQQYAQHADEFRSFLQSRRAAQAEPAVDPDAQPEFDESWLRQVDQDEATGMYRALPGVNPVVADKLNAYASWLRKYQTNPIGFVQRYVEKNVEKLVAPILEKRFGAIQEQAHVANILQTRAPILYQYDAQGAPVRDLGGRMVLSEAGRLYVHFVKQASDMGIMSPQKADEYASNMTAAAVLSMQPQSHTNGQRGQQALGRPNTNPQQTMVAPLSRSANPGSQSVVPTGRSLKQMLQEDLAAQGITDADFDWTA